MLECLLDFVPDSGDLLASGKKNKACLPPGSPKRQSPREFWQSRRSPRWVAHTHSYDTFAMRCPSLKSGMSWPGASAYKASARLGLSLDTLVGRREVWRIFTCHFAFSTAGELVLGLVLLYTFRQFERHWGQRSFSLLLLRLDFLIVS